MVPEVSVFRAFKLKASPDPKVAEVPLALVTAMIVLPCEFENMIRSPGFSFVLVFVTSMQVVSKFTVSVLPASVKVPLQAGCAGGPGFAG